jgi:hypothetical protein
MFELDNDDKEEDELEEYLRKPVVAFKTDPLQWWKVSCNINNNIPVYPFNYICIIGA